MPDPPKNQIDWSASPKWNYRFEGDLEGLLYPATPSSFLLAGIYVSNVEKAEVVDLLTNKVLGGFPTKIAGHSERALSPDGRYLAVSLHQPRGTVEVWAPKSAQASKVMQLAENDDIISYLAFRSPNELVVAGFTKVFGQFRKQLRVVNVETGATVSHLVTEKPLEFKSNTLSPGGRYFYSQNTNNTITAFDLDSGTCVGEVSLKTLSENGNSLSSVTGLQPPMSATDDGTQLCLIQTSPWETVLVFLDAASGVPVESITLPGQLDSIADNDVLYGGRKIQFMKGGNYILLDGQLLVHRKTKRIVWLLSILPAQDQFQLTNNAERRVAGDLLVISDGPRNFPELRAQAIPFDRIEAALAVVESGGAATLSPQKGEVALDIDVTSVRFGDVEQTKKELGATLTDRLGAEGLTVTPGASAVLKLQYAEGAGNTLSQSTFRLGVPRSQQQPAPSGQSLESSKAMMQLSLRIDKKEVWAKVIELDPRVLFVQGNATAETARASVFEHVQKALYGIPVVWYVSAEKPYVTLPVLETLQSESHSIGGRRPTRRPGSK
ncbi:MAG TPA: WD40 repeat domain-containing protein [Planctomycetaceae bacterium]|nr:WD40 repeat domain-containing protein [Planctomycetaceae bacterium]